MKTWIERKTFLVTFILVAICIMNTSSSSANNKKTVPIKVGLVVAISGRAVAIDTSGVKRQLKIKTPIFVGDTLKTKSKSKLQIMFKDTTTISIGQKAKMVIDEFIYKPGDNKSRCTTSIASGAFKILGGAISKMAPDQIMVKTPTATIGIRGTLGIGTASSDSSTVIYMGGGGISVAGHEIKPEGPNGPTSGSKGLVLLTGKPGMGTKVLRGKLPQKPRMFFPKEIKKIMEAVAIPVKQSADNGRRQRTWGKMGGLVPLPSIPPKGAYIPTGAEDIIKGVNDAATEAAQNATNKAADAAVDSQGTGGGGGFSVGGVSDGG